MPGSPTTANLFSKNKQQSTGTTTSAKIAAVDTSDWKTFTDAKYNLSFKYQPDWKISAATKKNGYTIIQIDPGKKYYNFLLYISAADYYAMAGLPAVQENISGCQATNVFNTLYGIKFGNLYYTFDIGKSFNLLPQFNAWVHSVKFQS